MKVVKVVAMGMLAGAVAAFVAALLRPRRPGGYDPWQVLAAEIESTEPVTAG